MPAPVNLHGTTDVSNPAPAASVPVLVDAAGNLQVDVVSISAGDINIGNVDVLSIAAGDNNIGNVDIVTLPTQTHKWSALSAISTVLLGADVAPTLKNLANNANLITLTAIDNSDSANRNQYAQFELLLRLVGAPTAGTPVKIWLLPSIDGSNFEDGAVAVTPDRTPDLVLTVRAVATAQRLITDRITLPPTAFHVLLRNETGQAFTNTDNENVLRMVTFNEIQ